MKEEKENKIDDITLTHLLRALAYEVALLKEDRCENEGTDWFYRFKNEMDAFDNRTTAFPQTESNNKTQTVKLPTKL